MKEIFYFQRLLVQTRSKNDLASAFKNVSLGLRAPRAGPSDQLLPGHPDHFPAISGSVRRVGYWVGSGDSWIGRTGGDAWFRWKL